MLSQSMGDSVNSSSVSSVLTLNIVNAQVISYLTHDEKREKYTDYRIEVTRGDEKWFVFRRYNEFDKLNEKIKKLYPEVKLKLPKKRLFGDNFDKDFIMKRLSGLNDFLQQATSYSTIMKMPSMLDFLSIKEPINVSVLEEDQDLQAFNNLVDSEPQNNNQLKVPTLTRVDSQEINLGNSNNPAASPKDFEYLSVIGKGSFGKVYMARHKIENKIYAIKILQKAAIKKRNEVKHIMAERNVLVRNIKHPFLVGLYYSFQTNDKLYFVLDFVNGGELFFHLQRQRVFSETRARFYAAEISHAIGYLHSNNIIYRDLKPENILIDSDGHIKLTDFGLCKEGINASTTTSTFCGTPEYLAPEILLKKPYTRAVDWWCLGAVLYEMLYGLPPFYSRDTNEMYNNILHKPLKVNTTSNVSPYAKNIIEGLLRKDQENRLGSSTEDFNEIKNHQFFEAINWTRLLEKKIDPPWKPNIRDSTDLRNIDTEFTQEQVSGSVVTSTNTLGVKDPAFTGFTYVPESAFNNF